MTDTSTAENVSDIKEFPFLVKTLITFTRTNAAGNEEKHKDDVVFKLDAASAVMPWYVLRNFSVPKYLTKKYGPHEVSWQRIYEIRILKLINRKNPNDITDIPLRVMTLEQLAEFVEKWDLNVPVTEFYSVEKSREMVALRQADEKGYERHLKEYREGKNRSYPELDHMRGDAEAAIAEDSEFDVLEKRVSVTPKKKTPSSAEAVAGLSDAEEKLLNDQSIPGPGDQPSASNPFANV